MSNQSPLKGFRKLGGNSQPPQPEEENSKNPPPPQSEEPPYDPFAAQRNANRANQAPNYPPPPPWQKTEAGQTPPPPAQPNPSYDPFAAQRNANQGNQAPTYPPPAQQTWQQSQYTQPVNQSQFSAPQNTANQYISPAPVNTNSGSFAQNVFKGGVLPVIMIIGGLVTVGFLLMSVGAEDAGVLFIILGLAVHAISGFAGLGILFKKGWGLETMGCILILGGAPIAFPILFGFAFLIIANFVPDKFSQKKP